MDQLSRFIPSFTMAIILKRLYLSLVISIMVFSGCCARPVMPHSPLSMSDEKIISQGEDAIIYVLSVCLNLKACDTKRIMRFKKEILKKYPDWTEKTKAAVLKGEVFIGMTKKQVTASWGEPKRIVKTIANNKTQELFVYSSRQNLLFDDEILSAVRTP